MVDGDCLGDGGLASSMPDWRLSDVDDEGKASNNVEPNKRGAKAMAVLIVTGGSRGIGAEISRLAGARGWSVCVNYAAAEDAAKAVVGEIEGAGRYLKFRSS